VVGKIAGDCDVPLIQHIASDRLQAREQVSVAEGLSVVFITGDE
jgi:hypothetical protein